MGYSEALRCGRDSILGSLVVEVDSLNTIVWMTSQKGCLWRTRILIKEIAWLPNNREVAFDFSFLYRPTQRQIDWQELIKCSILGVVNVSSSSLMF